MQVLLQTRFNPPMVVYDSDVPGSGTGILKSLFNPVLQVQQGSLTLYKTGEFYEDNSLMNLMLVAGVAVGLIYGIRRLLR